MQKTKFNRTVYNIQSFLAVDVTIWGTRLKEHHIDCMNEVASLSQRKAWFDCFNILRKEFLLLALPKEILNKVYVIFEYELPRERGRRPDVLILAGNNLIVLEFKGDYAPLPSLIHSAQLLFKEKSFPQIKQAQSAGIPKTIAKLKKISKQSDEKNSHH